MYLSKITAFLVTLAALGAVSLAVLELRPGARALDASERARLDGAQHAAELLLKLNAREWIDAAARLAGDATLMEQLDGVAQKRVGEAEAHKTLLERLRFFNMKLKATQVIALDLEGRVIARLSEDAASEREYRDSLAGVPLVAAALRGYRADDVWSRDGKLYRVAASPIFARSRDRTVGALVLGQEIGDALAAELKQSLDVDVAFMVRGKVIATSATSPGLGDFPKALDRRGDEVRRQGRSVATEIKEGEGSLFAVFALFRGEAAAHDAAYALFIQRPQLGGPMTIVRGLHASDLVELPWVLLACLFILGILGTVIFHTLEADRPLSRLRADSARLIDGTLSKLDDQLPGRFGAVARNVNAALEERRRPSRPPAAAPAAPDRDSGGIVEEIGPAPTPAARSAGRSGTPPPPRLGETIPAAAPPSAPVGGPEIGAGSDLPTFPGARYRGGAVRPPLPPPGAGGGPASISLPSLGGEQVPDDPMAALAALGIGGSPPSPVAPPPMASGPRTPAPRLVAPLDPFEDPGLAAPPPARVAPAAPNATEHDASAGGADEDTHFRQVFEEFLAAKQQCGEPTETLTVERFLVKLRGNRDDLVARFACRTVRFTVYIKDGKAALKATPVKD